MMIKVYGRASSSNVQAVLWGLEEMGLAYEQLDYGFTFGGLDTPEFRAMNPHGKIPVLQDGDTVVWESAAILRYLATAYGTAPFWPEDPGARARVDMWAEWAKNSVAAQFTGPVFWLAVRIKPEKRNWTVIQRNVARLEAEMTHAGRVLAQQAYLAGPDLTVADIALGHVLYRYFDIDIQRANMPNLRAYYDRLTERAAYRNTVMTSYEMLRDSFG
ncbi:MAG: glutathione S-transferase family protein [Pseudomonadota bacterium]